nr:protein kinase superfamily protein [Tanacetum cinerariifolium]
AKVSIQGGMKKGQAKDKSPLSKANKGDYYDAIEAFPKPRQASSDEEDSARTSALLASAPLSVLVVPSLKESVVDDLEAHVVRSVISSLMDMEYRNAGSCVDGRGMCHSDYVVMSSLLKYVFLELKDNKQRTTPLLLLL